MYNGDGSQSAPPAESSKEWYIAREVSLSEILVRSFSYAFKVSYDRVIEKQKKNKKPTTLILQKQKTGQDIVVMEKQRPGMISRCKMVILNNSMEVLVMDIFTFHLRILNTIPHSMDDTKMHIRLKCTVKKFMSHHVAFLHCSIVKTQAEVGLGLIIAAVTGPK